MNFVPKSSEIAFVRNIVAAYIPSESLDKINFDAHLVYAEAVLERPEGARQMPAGSLEAFLALWEVSNEAALAYVANMPVENTTGTGIEDVVRTLRDFGRFFRDPRATTALDRAISEIFGATKIEPAIWSDTLINDSAYGIVRFFQSHHSCNTNGSGILDYDPVLVTKLRAHVIGEVDPILVARAFFMLRANYRGRAMRYPLAVLLNGGVDLLLHLPKNDVVELEGEFGSGWPQNIGLTVILEGWRKAQCW